MKNNLPPSKNKTVLWVSLGFIVFVFVYYFLWSYSKPLNFGPDEAMRYNVAQFIYEHGQLPHGGDPSIRNPIWGISYAFELYFPQIISALFMKITSFFTTAPHALLVAARLVNVLSITATVWFSILISRKLISNRLYRILFVCLIAFLPQFVFLGSYVNNDSVAILSSSIIIYAWILGLETKWNLKSCLILTGGLSLCILSYYNAYGFVLCSILLFILSNLIFHGRLVKNKEFWGKFLFVAVLTFLLAGWWFIRNAIIYDGDLLGMATADQYKEWYAIDQFKPSLSHSIQETGCSLYGMLTLKNWAALSYKSMIGCFGFMEYWLPHSVYVFYTALFLLGFAGLVYWGIRWIKKHKGGLRQTLGKQETKLKILLYACFASCIAIPVVLSAYYSYTSDFQPQGRYLLSLLLPFAFFVVSGIQRLGERMLKPLVQKILVGCICGAIVFISFYSYFEILLPAKR